MQVGHQGNSETVGEHQVGGYCIHYHSVRHGTANECQDDVGDTQWEELTDRQRLYTTAGHMNMHKQHDIQVLSSRTNRKHPLAKDEDRFSVKSCWLMSSKRGIQLKNNDKLSLKVLPGRTHVSATNVTPLTML